MLELQIPGILGNQVQAKIKLWVILATSLMLSNEWLCRCAALHIHNSAGRHAPLRCTACKVTHTLPHPPEPCKDGGDL